MWPNPQFSADLTTFTEEILNGKIHFLHSEIIPTDILRVPLGLIFYLKINGLS